MTNLIDSNELLKKQQLLIEIANNIIAQAKQQGADQCEVSLDVHHAFSVNVRMGEIEKIEFNRDKTVSIGVYFGKNRGTTVSTDISPEAITQSLKAACNIARFTGSDPYAGLAEQSLMAHDYPDLDLHHPWNLTPKQAIDKALECERIALEQDQRLINSEGAWLTSAQGIDIYANSHGFIGGFPISRHSFGCTIIGKENDDMQQNYDYTCSRDPNLLNEIATVSKNAAKKTLDSLSPRKVKTGKYPVIFSANTAKSLIGHLLTAISGYQLYRQTSFLLNHLEQKIFPDFISIQEFPFIAKGLGSAPFDHDGLLCRENIFINDGVLSNYLLSTYSARQLGLKSSANAGGAHNVKITHSDKDLPELLQQMQQGILITELMGQGVNIMNGDYSRGASGFWVENGEIQYPVAEITIANNLADMFKQIVCIANDIDLRSNIHTGSILLEEMTVAGN